MRQSLCYLAIICLSSIIIPNVSGQVEEFNVAQNVYEKNHGESIAAKFFGYVEETKFGKITLKLLTPSGIEIENRIFPTSAGYFELWQYLDSDADVGTYQGTAVYNNQIIGTSSFELVDKNNSSITKQDKILEEQNQIPPWIKNIFVWYGDDMISEMELLIAIKFLVNEGIINLKD